jgi:hypothetical protein
MPSRGTPVLLGSVGRLPMSAASALTFPVRPSRPAPGPPFLVADTFAFNQSTQAATVIIEFTTDYGTQAAAAVAVTVGLVLWS